MERVVSRQEVWGAEIAALRRRVSSSQDGVPVGWGWMRHECQRQMVLAQDRARATESEQEGQEV